MTSGNCQRSDCGAVWCDHHKGQVGGKIQGQRPVNISAGFRVRSLSVPSRDRGGGSTCGDCAHQEPRRPRLYVCRQLGIGQRLGDQSSSEEPRRSDDPGWSHAVRARRRPWKLRGGSDGDAEHRPKRNTDGKSHVCRDANYHPDDHSGAADSDGHVHDHANGNWRSRLRDRPDRT